MMSQIYLKNKQKNLLNKKKEEQEEFSASTLFFLDVYECFCKW